jgi:serine/threonine protein kinase
MSDIAPNRVIAGKYRLLERIAGGGMGSLWRAHHIPLDAPIAVKFMHRSLLEVAGALARFEREAKAVAQLRSPSVVHMYDHGIDAETGMPFIAMELLEGEDLEDRLKRAPVLPPDQLSRICQQVCRGLGRAHETGIVHRDMKPANIFLCKPDDEVIKILDFGIAKETGEQQVVQSDATTDGQLLGSPRYMSPEQARGLKLDGRSDLWSLAVIMFLALTGQRPFDGDNIGGVLVRICTEPAPAPSSINGQLGAEVDGFFERAFDRDPRRRFQTAKAFADAFAKALVGVSVTQKVDAPHKIAVPHKIGTPRNGGALPDLPLLNVSSLSGSSRLARPSRIVYRETTEAKKKGGLRSARLAVTIGALLAGAIVLLTWVQPGGLTPSVVMDTISYAVGAFVEAASNSDEQAGDRASEDPSATPAAAAGSADAEGRSKEARNAWLTTYKHVRMNEIPLAIDSLPRLVKVYPDAPVDKRNTFLLIAERGFARRGPTSDKLAKLMTTEMGEHGPDLLFDLVATRGETLAAKRAARLLADATVRKRGSKDMQLAHAIHTASACGKKVQVLRAKGEGGTRTLREIRTLTSHCKQRQRCCLKDDKAVAAIETAIQARQ